MSASPSPSSQQVGKQPHQWFSLHLLFLAGTQSEGDVRGCIQISEALSMHQRIYCPGHWDTSQVPSPGQELSSPLRVDSSLWRCDSAGQHSNAISLCGFASRESNHLCTFLESLGYLTAVAETPSSSPSTCHLVRRGSSGAKSQGSCLGYLWQGAREDWAGDTGEYLLKSHKTFLVNQNSENYTACWPGLGIYHDLGHPFK